MIVCMYIYSNNNNIPLSGLSLAPAHGRAAACPSLRSQPVCIYRYMSTISYILYAHTYLPMYNI